MKNLAELKYQPLGSGSVECVVKDGSDSSSGAEDLVDIENDYMVDGGSYTEVTGGLRHSTGGLIHVHN